MFESRKEPLAPRHAFLSRMLKYLGLASIVVLVALGVLLLVTFVPALSLWLPAQLR